MTRGRKPTAPHLKLLAGTNRPDREQPEAIKYDLLEEFPPPPQHLNPDGAEMWNRLGPQLVMAQVLQVVDLYALEQLCFAWQRLRQKAKAGVDVTASEDTAFKSLLSGFGMTPDSRRKVTGGDQGKKPSNPFANNGNRRK